MSPVGPLLILPSAYPAPGQPSAGIFVRHLVEEFARLDANPTVIAPTPRRLRTNIRLAQQDTVPTLRPHFWSLSNRVLPGGFSTFRLTCALFGRAARHAAKSLPAPPRAIYAHFFHPAGAAALAIASDIGVPAFIGLGEGNLSYYERHIGIDRLRKSAEQVSGFICVSPANAAYCHEQLGVEENRILLCPNAADTGRFRPGDRSSLRRELDLPQDRFIVAFVGHFNENKGPLRLFAALEQVPGAAGIFLGEGPQHPAGTSVLHAGRVCPKEMPKWLAAADAFALPTREEASSNALAEALACGLPSVVANIPNLRAMAPDSACRFVLPDDVDGLAEALKDLSNDIGLRDRMGSAARQHAEANSLKDRALTMLDWMASRC